MAQRCAIHERLCQLAKRYGDRALELVKCRLDGLLVSLQDASWLGCRLFYVLELGGTMGLVIYRMDDR